MLVFPYSPQFWVSQMHFQISYGKECSWGSETVFFDFVTRFVGGELNTCYEALDKHVDDGFGDQTAFIYDSPVANKKQRLSYKKMKHEASKFARVLLDLGVTKGDRVVIYMPMIPEVRSLALIDFS